MKPTRDKWIKFNPRIGPEPLVYIGYTGSGKTNHVLDMMYECMVDRGEAGLTHGDLSCEWRHYTRYPKLQDRIEVIVPLELKGKITWYCKDKKREEKYGPDNWTYVDYTKLDIVKHLRKGKLTVVYDDCYRSESSTRLWSNLLTDIWRRKTKHKMVIAYFCNEAGNTYPQSATKKQWEELDYFCELMVRFRKRKIRALLVSQIESEIYFRVREKATWRIFKRCIPGKRSVGKKIRKYFSKTNIDNYHIFYGEIFNPLCKNNYFEEIEKEWLMIPPSLMTLSAEISKTQSIQLKGSPPPTSSSSFPEVTCQKCGNSWIPKVLKPKRCTSCRRYMVYNEEEIAA